MVDEHSQAPVYDRYVDGKLAGSQAFEGPDREHDPDAVLNLLSEIGFVDARLAGYHGGTAARRLE